MIIITKSIFIRVLSKDQCFSYPYVSVKEQSTYLEDLKDFSFKKETQEISQDGQTFTLAMFFELYRIILI